MSESSRELRSLALTPTWSVATVLTILVAVCLLVERLIFRLSCWLRSNHRNPLFDALEKMKEELMLLGFISLLLTATSRTISNICIDSKYYNGNFSPCSISEFVESEETNSSSLHDDKHFLGLVHHLSLKRTVLEDLARSTCGEGYEPFVSYEGLEQLHRFIFVMAVTHIVYSCLTMLLASVKIHTWRNWEEEAQRSQEETLAVVARALTMRRQSSFVRLQDPNPWNRNGCIIWFTCFLRQFGQSVVRGDYLTLRTGFITNHNLMPGFNFHGYILRSMEEEFKVVVGVSVPLWGFVIAFMLFNVHGSNLYFWISVIPMIFVLLVGTKLQHVIATLALENADLAGHTPGSKALNPRDELFWFNKPELLLLLIHFILFQNSFELATFIWFWWQFGFNSCFIRNHWVLYARLLLGFSSQFLISYSTLPLYALVTQMGSHYKAAIIPQRVRDTIHSWRKDARKKRRKRRPGSYDDCTTVHTETSTVCSIEEEEDDEHLDSHYVHIGLEPMTSRRVEEYVREARMDDPLLHAASVPSSPVRKTPGDIIRSFSMPPYMNPAPASSKGDTLLS